MLRHATSAPHSENSSVEAAVSETFGAVPPSRRTTRDGRYPLVAVHRRSICGWSEFCLFVVARPLRGDPVRTQAWLVRAIVALSPARLRSSAAGRGLARQARGHTPPTAIVGASVVNLNGGPALQDAVVIIEGERIAAIGPAATTPMPQGAEVIRATGRWISPGLMNMHTHYGLVLPGRAGAELANESEAALALRMAANARTSLMTGVTTTRSTGESKGADFALRRAIDRGEAVGPRIFTAGQSLRVTGGHGWSTAMKGSTTPTRSAAPSPRGLRRRRVDQDSPSRAASPTHTATSPPPT